jgi:SAM-dependent methyltransferase
MVGVPLFGDRARFGLDVRTDDPDWVAWQRLFMSFYRDTQRTGVGTAVNDSGYRVLRSVSLEGKTVLELGPGSIPHMSQWLGSPARYTVVEQNPEMRTETIRRLHARGVPAEGLAAMPTRAGAIHDIILAFFCLEHLRDLDEYLAQIDGLLADGGLLVGAIPAEGGLAWGLGRWLTSRRYIKRNSSANPDKIICWEHPNFSDAILRAMDRRFEQVRLRYWPLRVPLLDVNLVVSFIYRKRKGALTG